jgi:protein-disulfide isomerase
MSTNPAERQSRDQRRQAAREGRQAAEAASAASAARRKRLWQLLAVLGGALVVVVVAILISSSGATKSAPKLHAGQKPAGTVAVTKQFAGIPETGTTLGRANAPVTMHEYADLKCPICRIYSLTILPKLIDRYVRTGKLKIVFEPQHFVGEQLNPGDSGAAATFGLAAARQNRMWPFSELFYRNQQDETTRYVTDDFLRQIASGVPGLNADKALAQRDDPAIQRQLAAAGDAFDANGFTGTPSFTVGRSAGAQKPIDTSLLTLNEFTSAIDRQLPSR